MCCRKCCGECYWFTGEKHDGIQFCDELEKFVEADGAICKRFKGKSKEINES